MSKFFLEMRAKTFQGKNNILENTFWEHAGGLKHDSDFSPQMVNIRTLFVNVISGHPNPALDVKSGNPVIHPANCAQKGGFTRTGGANDPCHGFFRNFQVEIPKYGFAVIGNTG